MGSPRLQEHARQGVRRGVVFVDWLLRTMSIYIIPMAMAGVAVWALLFWQSNYLSAGGHTLMMRVLPQAAVELTPEQALAALANRPLKSFHDTNLSEEPVWLLVDLPVSMAQPPSLLFPSRHAVAMACWDGKSLVSLGQAAREQASGSLISMKAGFGLPEASAGLSVLCRAAFVGPARLQADWWVQADLQASVLEFHRNLGLLEGGLVVLGMFVLMTALINRQSLYVLFAAWLVVTLRVGAISAGWDVQWLGHLVPTPWLFPTRALTVAVYGFLTITLYKNLFQEDLDRSRLGPWIRGAQWACIPLLLAAVFLPYGLYLQMMWVSTGVGLLLMTVSLVRIVFKTRSRVAMWYAASLGVTFLSSFSEIVAAAYGMKVLVGTVNHVTAALSSSLLAALAIAEQMRQEHVKRLEVQAQLQYAYEAMPIGLFTLDLQGRFLSANPALVDMLGDGLLENGGRTWRAQFGDAAWLQLDQMVHSQSETETEFAVNGRDDGELTRRFMVRATQARGRIEGSLQDVTEKSRATENLRVLAHHDALTRVLNRRGIEQVLESALAQRNQGKPLALAYLDLDRFKLINDLFGHAAGDDVLQQVCARVSQMLSGSMQIGRVGGDEFLIVFPDTHITLARLISQGIVASICTSPYRVGARSFHVRGSIGLIEVAPGSTIRDVVSTADHACRDAKRGLQQGLAVYERDAPGLIAHETEMKLVERLSSDERIEGLYLEMQPIMSLTAPTESLNFEVLLRMRDASGALVPTPRLIAAGEHSGRMGVIDRWVLGTVFEWLGKHHGQLGRTQFVCLNLSGASLNDEAFIDDVFALFDEHPHLASWLCLEITESVALHDLENTRRFISQVRSYGAKVALDDFGAGYTSFSYLKDLPSDLLKIDGNFIVNMNRHPANVAIVEAIVSLARNLGMKTIAEWAEDQATVQTLAEIGVDYVQGFVVARPQSPEALLTASSAASFIEDPQLLQFVQLLGASGPPSGQGGLFGERRSDSPGH